jgi:hypothetical protein
MDRTRPAELGAQPPHGHESEPIEHLTHGDGCPNDFKIHPGHSAPCDPDRQLAREEIKYTSQRSLARKVSLGGETINEGNLANFLSRRPTPTFDEDRIEQIARVLQHRVVVISEADVPVNRNEYERTLKELKTLRAFGTRVKKMLEKLPVGD